MTVRRPKASVVVDPYETEVSKNKKKEKEKSSTVACSDNSIRKWKVSEAITPVVTEFDRFSLKILSENSTNHSYGSLNETFEKNVNFNFQSSYTSSSIDSHTKKVSISAFPLFRTISPVKYNESITSKREINVINESPVEDSDQLCPNSTNDETFPNSKNNETFSKPTKAETFSKSTIAETFSKSTNAETFSKSTNAETFSKSTNAETFSKSTNAETFSKSTNVEKFPKSTIPESCVESVIKETPEPEEFEYSAKSIVEELDIPSTEKSMEIVEDIDDVQLSSVIDDNESTKSPSFNELVSEKSSFIDVYKSPKHIEGKNRLKVGRQAKKNAKENIIKQCQIFNEFRFPVDIDASQVSLSQEIKKPKIVTIKSPILKRPTPSVNESIGPQSKLCDTSKAYLHSQESSLISSPLEQERLKSACQLPGRASFLVPNQTTNKKIDEPAIRDISNVINNEITNKRQFFKSSFCERRRLEIERFTNLINNKPIKESAQLIKPVKETARKNKPKKAKTSPKPRKSRAVKKKAESKKKIKEITEDLICSGNSDEKQINKITIEDSENTKCDQPIEKARGGSTHSSDDLFSFTPQFVQKRKLKTLKTKSKKNRLTNSSEIYDVLSDVSSPLSKRKSLMSYKSNKKSIRLGDEVIGGCDSIIEMIINFESDIDRIKGIQQSMTYQLNQFKKVLASSNII